ncbi:transposase [Streptococcus pseudopneumoniae 5247]|nr:transposase [Streptococcus pseudopneumoniae 5247]
MLSFKQACYNKAMAYSTDFKQRALDYIKEGHSHVEAAKVFDVGVRTLFTWEKKDVNKDT